MERDVLNGWCGGLQKVAPEKKRLRDLWYIRPMPPQPSYGWLPKCYPPPRPVFLPLTIDTTLHSILVWKPSHSEAKIGKKISQNASHMWKKSFCFHTLCQQNLGSERRFLVAECVLQTLDSLAKKWLILSVKKPKEPLLLAWFSETLVMHYYPYSSTKCVRGKRLVFIGHWIGTNWTRKPLNGCFTCCQNTFHMQWSFLVNTKLLRPFGRVLHIDILLWMMPTGFSKHLKQHHIW